MDNVRKQRLYYIIYIVIISLSALSCKRQHLYKKGASCHEADISLSIDWSKSAIPSGNIENVSIYAYPINGGDPYVKISGDITTPYINLPIGVYSVLVFNDAVENILEVDFKHNNIYTQFSAFAIKDPSTNSSFYQLSEGEYFLYNHGQVAAWRVDSLEVTEDMVRCQYCQPELINGNSIEHQIAPTPVTSLCTVTLQIENLNNAQIINGVLRGFSQGAYLASNNRISSDDGINLYQINFPTRSYDNEQIDGVAEGQVVTFGKNSNDDTSYELIINIILNNGELVTFQRDVTEQVISSDEFNIIINLNNFNDRITLPASKGTGFGVDSWGDSEHIELL